MIVLPYVMREVRFAPRKQKSGNYSLQVSLKIRTTWILLVKKV